MNAHPPIDPISHIDPIFVSHGSPMMILEPETPAHRFMSGLAAALPRPRAVLIVSAHWMTLAPSVTTGERLSTIHDFSGFPRALYEVEYPAHGAPRLAERVTELAAATGIAVRGDAARGLDHGAWTPMSLMWPDASVPVAQLSLSARGDAAWHLALGRALAPLADEGVLVLASGAATHNLMALDWNGDGTRVAPWAASFIDWLGDAVERGDEAALTDWKARAPNGRMAHPTDEHLMPLFVAFGAAGGGAAGAADVAGRVLHESFALGSLAMHAYAFGRAIPAEIAA